MSPQHRLLANKFRQLVCLLLLALPSAAHAFQPEPNRVVLKAGLGPAIQAAHLLGGSPANLTLSLGGEYLIDSAFSVITDVSIGIAPTIPLRWHGGLQYRLDIGLPLFPVIQLQATAAQIWNMLGANLAAYGARVGLGADYFLTKDLSTGCVLAADLTSTTGQRPAFLGYVDILLTSTYSF